MFYRTAPLLQDSTQGVENMVWTAVMPQVETPVAVVDKNVAQRSARTRAATIQAAHAFADYLYTPQAQQEFADCGFRSAVFFPA